MIKITIGTATLALACSLAIGANAQLVTIKQTLAADRRHHCHDGDGDMQVAGLQRVSAHHRQYGRSAGGDARRQYRPAHHGEFDAQGLDLARDSVSPRASSPRTSAGQPMPARCGLAT